MPFQAICMPMHMRMKAMTRRIPCTVAGGMARVMTRRVRIADVDKDAEDDDGEEESAVTEQVLR